MAGLVLSGSSASTTENAAQALFLNLTVRVVAILVILVAATTQFRGEIEQDTLTYLSTRSVTRPDIALGKYLGAVGASLLILVPAGFVPLLVAGLGGAPPPPTSVSASILVISVLATLSYGAFFLFLGLVTRNALVVGLLYGFLWEQLLLLLPGDFPRLTVLYYLSSFAGLEVSSGPFSEVPAVIPVWVAVLAPIVVAGFYLGLTAGLFRFVETAPQRTTA